MKILDKIKEVKELLHKVADVLGSALDVILTFKNTFSKKEEIEDVKKETDSIEE